MGEPVNKSSAANYVSLQNHLRLALKAAERLNKNRSIPENWRQDAGTLQADLDKLMVQHSLDHRAQTANYEYWKSTQGAK